MNSRNADVIRREHHPHLERQLRALLLVLNAPREPAPEPESADNNQDRSERHNVTVMARSVSV